MRVRGRCLAAAAWDGLATDLAGVGVVVWVGDYRVGGGVVAGSDVVGDVGGGGAVRGVVERGGGSGGEGGRSGAGGGEGV